jgi:heat induced stress protein YflT
MKENAAVTSLPARRIVASLSTYEEAQRAVDYLSDEKFPVERVAIVGEGLRLVEQVTGRWTWGRAALDGLLSGVFIGLLLGWLLGLFNLVNPLVSTMMLALYGLILGAVMGAIAGLLGYAIGGGQRDFISVSMMQAAHYNILVDADMADDAQRLLARMPT